MWRTTSNISIDTRYFGWNEKQNQANNIGYPSNLFFFNFFFIYTLPYYPKKKRKGKKTVNNGFIFPSTDISNILRFCCLQSLYFIVLPKIPLYPSLPTLFSFQKSENNFLFLFSSNVWLMVIINFVLNVYWIQYQTVLLI